MKKSLVLLVFIVYYINLLSQDKVYAPQLVSPPNGAINQMVDCFVDFTSVAGAFYYEIQFDTSDAFTNPVIVYTSYSAGNAHSLFYGKQYYWRVRAIGANNVTSAWSNFWSFTVIDKPTPVYPLNNYSQVNTTPIFKWNKITGSSGYIIQVDTVSDFSSPYMHLVSTGNINELAIHLYYYNMTYYWRISAFHELDTSDWSNTLEFKTRAYPILQKPTNNSVDVIPTVMLQFKAIWGATQYQYQYSTDSTFSTYNQINVPLSYQTIINPNNPNTRDTVLILRADTFKFGQKIYWRARAMNTKDISLWSPYFQMDVIAGVKTLFSPQQGATIATTKPTFKWRKIPEVIKYELQYSTDSNFLNNVVSVFVPHPNVPHDTVSYAVTTHLQQSTQYYWRVRAINTRDTSEWKSSFFTSGTNTFVDDYTKLLNFSIFPNPASEQLFITFNATSTFAYSLKITNLIGQTIFSVDEVASTGKVTLTFDLKESTEGLYFITFKTPMQIITRKFYIEK